MNRKAAAVLGAILTFASSSLIPLMIPQILPPEVLSAASMLPFDLTSYVNEIALIGAVMAVLALSKGFIDPASPIHLGISMISNLLWLVLIFRVIGFGSFDTLGVTTFTMEVMGAVNTVTLDFQVFVYFAISLTLLKIVHSFLEFRDARLEKI
jgi:hypothetical protein